MNHVTMMGRLTRDPEVRYTQSGLAVCKFGIAVDTYRGKNDAGEARKETCFIDCVGFGGLADVLVKNFRKGKPIVVAGRLNFSQWESEGQKRSKHEIVIDTFNFVLSDSTSSKDDGSAPF